jgi:peptide/nickel transport system ATP-binding protein
MSPLVDVQGVSVLYDGKVRALDDVSFLLMPRESVGLVGESGSGKTTLCRVMMGLVPPTEGWVVVDGVRLRDLIARDRLAYRRRAQMLQQDAMASLSPRMRLRDQLAEPLAIHGIDHVAGWALVLVLLRKMGLSEGVLDKYPHQISGGQARRVAVARALVLRPALIVADEPTAGLDVSVQGDLLNLLLDLQAEFSLTYLVASHNLNVIRRISHRIVVMYLGQIVEQGATSDVFTRPAHPYTAALLSTNPVVDPAKRRTRIVLQGEIPSVVNPPSGCRFHTRCPQVQERCRVDVPELRDVAGREVRCHFPLNE